MRPEFATLMLVLTQIYTLICIYGNCDEIKKFKELSEKSQEQKVSTNFKLNEILSSIKYKKIDVDSNGEKTWAPRSFFEDSVTGRLVKRAVEPTIRSRGKMKLASRPKTTTSSTTTSTTTPTSTTSQTSSSIRSSETDEQNVEIETDSEALESGEYELDETARLETPEEEKEEEEEEEEAPTSTTLATTSTKRPMPKPSTSQGMSKKTSAAKSKPQLTTDVEGTSKSEKKDKEQDKIDTDHLIKTPKQQPASNRTRKALVKLPFIKPKNESACTPEAYLEFPHDLIGNKWRSRGLVIIHIAIVCYMFYSLALVCEKYFMPSLEEFSHRLGLSEDVAGATLMSAGSSAPELFTALLGVFIAKGDVGTGAIVGSAVFNILFVIGVCAFVSTNMAQLNWWPVLRDSLFYTLTVLVLILFIYDERITAFESGFMIALYGAYIMIMKYNDQLRDLVTKILMSNPNTAKLIGGRNSIDGSDDVFGLSSASQAVGIANPYQTSSLNTIKTVEEDSIFMAACLVINQYKRLFRSQLRFQFAARYIITKRQHRAKESQKPKATFHSDEVNYFGPETETLTAKGAGQKKRIEAYAKSSTISKNKFSIVSRDDYEFWNRPPEEGENYYLWLAKIPVNYALHYTIPDCALYPDRYLLAFFMSILWTAFFSYVNVWMVTLIGYTFGVPDSVMGVTFLAAGTSVPDCYSSIHAAKNGMADMAVSNSIGSNVFDILIGLAVPWFIQSALYPGVVATINSRGIVYSVILLFLSITVTIYLMNKYEWTLKPRLGLALLIAYALFIVLTCMLEFNLFGYVNPPPCPVSS